jgi:sulfite reductase (ferredoxin)
VLPRVRTDVDAALDDAGVGGEPIVVRMTGCPNGCARPYTAELALVGRTGNKFLIYLGGNRVGTRLARPFLDLVPITDLRRTLTPVFRRFHDERSPAEAFGDYCDRVGLDSLKAAVAR